MESTKFLLFLLVAMPYFLAVADAVLKVSRYNHIEECEPITDLEECEKCCEKYSNIGEISDGECMCARTGEQQIDEFDEGFRQFKEIYGQHRVQPEAKLETGPASRVTPIGEPSFRAQGPSVSLEDHAMESEAKSEAEPNLHHTPTSSFSIVSRPSRLPSSSDSLFGSESNVQWARVARPKVSNTQFNPQHEFRLGFFNSPMSYDCLFAGTTKDCEECCTNKNHEGKFEDDKCECQSKEE